MKPIFAASFALILWAWPALAQTPDDFAACDSDPWRCLAEVVALVEANGADIEDYQGVLAAYAGALARHGDTERAASLVAQLEMPRDIIFGELALAKALQSAGRGEAAAASIGNAVLAMRQMDGRNDRWNYLVQIAGVQKEIGDMDAAKATLAPILAELAAMDGGRTRDDLTIAVIASGALDSDIDVALALINDIRNLYSQAKPMNAYIRFLVRAGQPAQALEAAFRVDPPKIRTAVLAALTEELAAVDEMELARRAADEAMNVLAVYDEGSSSYQTIIGDTARAMAWVDEDISFGLASLLMVNELTPKVSPRKFVQIMLDVAEARRIIGQEAGALSALQSALEIASVSRDVGIHMGMGAHHVLERIDPVDQREERIFFYQCHELAQPVRASLRHPTDQAAVEAHTQHVGKIAADSHKPPARSEEMAQPLPRGGAGGIKDGVKTLGHASRPIDGALSVETTR